MDILTITQNQLDAFIEQEKITRFFLDINEPDYVYLDTTDIQTLVHQYGVFNDLQQMIGFCIVPSYETDILQRIYISVLYRRMGYAQCAIKRLRIRSLGCLNDNHKALSLYKKLGFTQQLDTNQHYSILKLIKQS